MLRTVIWLVSLTMSAPVLADELQWAYFGDNVDLRLFYGVPESDIVTLNIICQPKRKRIDLVNFALPPKPRLGSILKTKLTNGAASLQYDGKVGRDRTHGATFAETRLGFDGKLFDFLGTGSTLIVETGRKRETIPLKGISRPLAEMRQGCLDGR